MKDDDIREVTEEAMSSALMLGGVLIYLFMVGLCVSLVFVVWVLT